MAGGGPKRTKIVSVGTVVAVVAGGIGWQSGLDGPVCRAASKHVVDRPPLCDPPLLNINDAQARIFASDFYAQSSGLVRGTQVDPTTGRPVQERGRDAWSLLSPELQARYTPERFATERAAWRWTEVTGIRRDAGFNVFRVTVRVYEQKASIGPVGMSGRVSHFDETVGLVRGDPTGFRVAALEGRAPVDSSTVVFPNVILNAAWASDDAAGTYRLPARASGKLSVARDYSVGGSFTALCQVERPTVDLDAGWWTRTPQGWIQNRYLVSDGQPTPGVPACETHHLLRAGAPFDV